jgi:hypothetical protein
MEIATDDPEELKRKCLAFGLKTVRHAYTPFEYVQAPSIQDCCQQRSPCYPREGERNWCGEAGRRLSIRAQSHFLRRFEDADPTK